MDEIEIDEFSVQVPSPETIRKRSVIEVTKANLYSKGLPNDYACNDLRMGTGK
jgi:hypothetical protein